MAEQTGRVPVHAPGEESRRALVRLAYRMLGSVEEAEDVVQDAHVRLLDALEPPRDAHAWLFRIVTNLCLDRLRHLKVRRRVYSGPWLPEPLPTPPPDGGDAAELADDLSVALLLLLERLPPSERVAFVLREACDLDFGEMAKLLGIGEPACRQRYHRARRKLGGSAAPSAPAPVHKRALERLMAAVSAGDADRVAQLLTDDALLITDGGGRVSAAIRPVETPARIARVLVHLASREPLEHFEWSLRHLNGGVGLLITRSPAHGTGERYASIQLDVASDRRISRIYIVRNPNKLTRL